MISSCVTEKTNYIESDKWNKDINIVASECVLNSIHSFLSVARGQT